MFAYIGQQKLSQQKVHHTKEDGGPTVAIWSVHLAAANKRAATLRYLAENLLFAFLN